MQLSVTDNPQTLAQWASRFLYQDEAANNLIIGMLAPEGSVNGTQFEPMYGAVVIANDIVTVALHKLGQTLVLTAAPPDAVMMIADDMAKRSLKPIGVVGPIASVEGFAKRWRQLTGCEYRQRYAMREYALTSVSDRSCVSGTYRRALVDETELLLSWQRAFMDEIKSSDDQTRALRRFAERLARDQVRVWHDGELVAMAAYRDVPPTASRIAPVYTLPVARSKGYASALVAALCTELLEGGKQACYLAADLANPTSNRIYQRIGFRPVRDQHHFDFVLPQ